VAWVTIIIVNWIVVSFVVGALIGHVLGRSAAAREDAPATGAVDRR
jgi:hypothetical protein